MSESFEPPLRQSGSEGLDAVWRYRWWLAAFAAVTLIAAGGFSLRQEKSYDATARVQIIPSQQLANAGLPDPAGLARFTDAYADIARSSSVIEATAKRIGRSASPATLRSSIDVSSDRSGTLTIRARAPSGRRAAAYANAVAATFVRRVAQDGESDRRSTVKRINGRIGFLTSRLREIDPRSGEARAIEATLQQLASQLADTEARPVDEARVTDAASVPSRPSSPRPVRTAVLALVFALLVGSALAYAHASLSNRFGSPEEASRDLSLPLLGALPQADPEAQVALDAFGILRTNIESGLSRLSDRTSPAAPEWLADADSSADGSMHATNDLGDRRWPPAPPVDAEGTVILVTSPREQSGKTYVTAGLAHAFAAQGRRVVAVDADLRRPKLHRRYSVPLEPGMSDFLDGFSDFLSDASTYSGAPTTRVRMPRSTAERGGALELLPAGCPRQDSSEVLASRRMAALAERVRRNFAVAVVNSPPWLSVADAALLVRHADGVILVIDARRTSRRAAEHAVRDLRLLSAPLLGIVFNRVSRDHVHRYGYGYNVAHPGSTPALRPYAHIAPEAAGSPEPGSRATGSAH
jgi:succinoglycan biosynthesis transport protein ExoP